MMTVDKLKFGIIADVQYACVENGTDFHQTQTRYYKASKEQLKEAVDIWNKTEIDFVVQLGDLLDGKCRKIGKSDDCLREMDCIFQQFKPRNMPTSKGSYQGLPSVHHIWGNHEFYNFTRSELSSSCLNSNVFSKSERYNEGFDTKKVDEESTYTYSFTYENIRFIALDVYDVARLGRPLHSELYNEANELLKQYNKTGDLMSSPTDNPNYVSWNGAVSQEQLKWLERELIDADKKNEKVIIFSHCPLHPMSCRAKYLVWNYEQVLEILNSKNNVIACFSGHDHNGGYYYDEVHNRMYMTLAGVIERPPHQNCFGVVEISQDKMFIKGYGVMEDRHLNFTKSF